MKTPKGIVVILAVILSLPHTLTCFPHEERYFVNLVPNATITDVYPPMVCIAQRAEPIGIRGKHFLKYNVDDDDTEEGGEMKYFFLPENATADNTTIASVEGQGVYEKKTVDGKTISNVGPKFASHLHKGKCSPSADECESYAAVLPDGTEELKVTWRDCVEGVTKLSSSAEPNDVPSTYEIEWPEEEYDSLYGQSVRSCSFFNVTLPQRHSDEHVVPELFVQQHSPAAPHAVDAEPERTLGPCQHSSFGRLVLMPPPVVTDLVPPAVCRQDSAATLVLTGAYLVRATEAADSEDAMAAGELVKATHIVTHVDMSGALRPAATNFTVDEDVLVAPGKLAFSQCSSIAVDRYEQVDACESVAVELAGSDHFTASDVDGNAANPIAAQIAPLSALTVRNPPPIDCVSTEPVEFRTVERPVVERWEPSMLCVAESEKDSVAVAETAAKAFLRVDEKTLTFESEGAELAAGAHEQCVDLPVRNHKLELCRRTTRTFASNADYTEAYFPPIKLKSPHINAAASCDTDAQGSMLFVPRPTLATAEPPFACRGSSVVIDLSGRYLVEHSADGVTLAKPSIRATPANVDYPPANITAVEDSCAALGAPNYTRAVNCSTMQLTLDASQLSASGAASVQSLSLTNPAPVDCGSENELEILVVDPPTLQTIEPAPIVCVADKDHQLTLKGMNFLRLVDETSENEPTVVLSRAVAAPAGTPTPPPIRLSIDNITDCTASMAAQRKIELCRTLTVTLTTAQFASLAGVMFDVVVDLPRQASSTPACSSSSLRLAVVGKASFTAEPLVPAVCRTSAAQELLFVGDWFLQVTGTAFGNNRQTVVTMNPGSQLTPALSDCDAAVTVGAGYAYTRCRRAITTVSSAQLGASVNSFTLTHSHPAPLDACVSPSAKSFGVVNRPTAVSASPSSVCIGSAGVVVTITGTFDQINGIPPFLDIQSASFPTRTASNCSPVNANGVSTCTTLSSTLDPQFAGNITAGPLNIKVSINAQCFDELSNAIIGLPTPAIATATPPRICHTTPSTVSFAGSRFVRQPPATITGGPTNTSLPIDSFAQCVMVGTQPTCSQVTLTTFTPMARGFSAGNDDTPLLITASNGMCAIARSDVISVVPVPDVQAVTPPAVCHDQTTPITVTGVRFSTNGFAKVRLIHAVDGDSVTVPSAAVSLRSQNNTAFELTVNANLLKPGEWDIEVTNVAGCVDTLAKGLNVHPILIVAFAAPPVLYSGVNIRVTVFSAGLLEKVDRVILRHSITGNELVVPGSMTTHAVNNAFNKIFFTVNAGLPAGAYDVELVSQIGCRGIANRVLAATNTTSVQITDIEPSYLEAAAGGGIRVSADNGGLERGLTVYLSPVNAGPTDLAIEVSSSVFESNTTLTGVVSAGQRATSYDAIVVNPSLTVGVLESGVLLVGKPVPRVVAAAPIVWEKGTMQDFVLSGSNLPAAADARASLQCRTPTMTFNDVLTLCPTGQCVSAGALQYTCPACSSDTLVVRTPSGSVAPSGAVCRVTVVDNSNGNATTNFQSLSIKNPSGKFASPFLAPQNNLLTARHAHAALPVRASDALRLLCAFGGASERSLLGNVSLSSVECSSVQPFGELTDFETQPQPLATGVAYPGGVVVGNYVYLVGGHTGMGGAATDIVQRAYVLQPAEAPVVVLEIDVDPKVTTQFANGVVGVYYYQVAALYSDSDAINPGGESLPSNVVPVKVPAVAGLSLRLEWPNATLDGVTKYAVYRTTQPDQLSTDVRLHAIVDVTTGCVSGTCRFIDNGAASPLSAAQRQIVPRALGQLGHWATLSQSLPKALYGVGVVNVPAVLTAQTGPSRVLFALGGYDGTAPVTDVYKLVIDVTTPACATGQRCARQVHTLPARWSSDAALTVARAFTTPQVITRNDFGTLAASDVRIALGNGIKASPNSYRADEAKYTSTTCTATSDCLAWSAATLSKSGGRINEYNCFVFRAATIAWYAGATGKTFSETNQFGTVTNDDSGQELNPSLLTTPNELVLEQGAAGGLTPTNADPPAVAASCAIENGNLYLVGGYTGTGVATAVHRLPGV